MRHLTPAGLDRLETLLGELRRLEGLREKRPGVFYRRSRAFLHFHEDAAELFADVRLGVDFERIRVTRRSEQRSLVTAIRRALEA